VPDYEVILERTSIQMVHVTERARITVRAPHPRSAIDLTSEHGETDRQYAGIVEDDQWETRRSREISRSYDHSPDPIDVNLQPRSEFAPELEVDAADIEEVVEGLIDQLCGDPYYNTNV